MVEANSPNYKAKQKQVHPLLVDVAPAPCSFNFNEQTGSPLAWLPFAWVSEMKQIN